MKESDARPLIYTAQSKQYFYCRDAVCQFVFEHGGIPMNPFRVFGYFLSDRVSRDEIRVANQRLLETCDEVWVFGDTLADGVVVEITQALLQEKPIQYFTIDASASEIEPIPAARLDFELDVLVNTGLDRPQILDNLLHGAAEHVVNALGRSRELRGRRTK